MSNFETRVKSNCIARSDADAINVAWCGKRGAKPFFLDLDHAAYHGSATLHPHAACGECLSAAIDALRRIDPAEAAIHAAVPRARAAA